MSVVIGSRLWLSDENVLRLIPRCQSKYVPEFIPNSIPAFLTHLAAFAEKPRGWNGIKHRAIRECLPVHSVRAVEQNFVSLWWAVLALAGAIKDVDPGLPAHIRPSYYDTWVLALAWELKTPNVELLFHSSGPLGP